MDEDLKQHLRGIEDRMVSMEERLVVLMRAQSDEVKRHVDERCARLETDLKTDLKTYVDHRCERLETALLTEFHKWASPVETRMRSHSVFLRALDTDLDAITERVKKIEGREPTQPH